MNPEGNPVRCIWHDDIGIYILTLKNGVLPPTFLRATAKSKPSKAALSIEYTTAPPQEIAEDGVQALLNLHICNAGAT